MPERYSGATEAARGRLRVVVKTAAAPAAQATDITNPAEHPAPITVTIDGNTFSDGQDTLPGYDDFACTPIPNVQYDFANNELQYYDGDGNLVKTVHWTEWSRISSYQTWADQQKASSPPSSGSDAAAPGGSGSSGSSPSTTTPGPSGDASTAPASPAAPVEVEASKVKAGKVKGAVTKAPTSRKKGAYKVTITAPKGDAVATGRVTIKLVNGKTKKRSSGDLIKGVATLSLPKLATGTWKVTISWPGDTKHLAASTAGGTVKVKR